MKKISLFTHVVAAVTLGILCGWYFILFLVIYPVLFYYAFFHYSYVAMAIFMLFIALTIVPIKYEPKEWFMYSTIFNIWKDYFDYEIDVRSIKGKMDKKEKFMFLEFPHGIFPMGQFLSASCIREIEEDQMIVGTGADIIFKIPIMRHIMAWVGTHPASRKNITRVLDKWGRIAIIPGGIAEMYLVNTKSEDIYLSKRTGTIKAAIQEGAHIVPAFFFNNSKLFTVLGEGSSDKSLLSRLSRSFRMSIVFFYGRFYLPIPYRIPLKLTTGDIIMVKQIANPTDADIDAVMQKVVNAVTKLYNEQRPVDEKRPLKIH